MGRSRYHIYDNRYPHFITATFIKWLPLNAYPKVSEILLASLRWLQENDSLQIFAWVFLENHCHFIARSPDLSHSISRWKSFTAKEIISYFEQIGHTLLLEEFTFGKKFHKQSQQYQIWQEGSHPEQIMDRLMMIQKCTYIHNNPLKRGYVDKPEEWRYSSARDYIGRDGLLLCIRNW